METQREPISVRVARINAKITNKHTASSLINRETLLDALQALFDECCIEQLQIQDESVYQFVTRFRKTMADLKYLRVNLSDFEIKNTIGTGQFGEVHVVKEKQTDDIFALKCVKKLDALDKSKCAFEEERNIMANGNSKWLTALHYSFQDSNYIYYVMDYHPGGDLLNVVVKQGGTLPESAATFYLAELVLALNDLHSMGYVHRDVKPENILLDRCGHLKLIDFGSAAKLNSQGIVACGSPVGTPEYVAPEVLRSCEDQIKTVGYGVSCDFWSVGIIAYELTTGSTPFTGQTPSVVYSKIMDHTNNLFFPDDIVLTHGYISFIKRLLTKQKERLSYQQIINHPAFKNIDFDNLHNQVPPYVPKLLSPDDTGNFCGIKVKTKEPNIDNFKKKLNFSGRNLPFVGFTFTPNPDEITSNFEKRIVVRDDTVQRLKTELDILKTHMLASSESVQENKNLKAKLDEKVKKLENAEAFRDKLEKDLADVMSENMAIKRTLELERNERTELEKKALDLIRIAKSKWETLEKTRTESLLLEIEQQKQQICELTNVNKMLHEQLQCAFETEENHKESAARVKNLNRKSVIGLELCLEEVSNQAQQKIFDLQSRISSEKQIILALEHDLEESKENEKILGTQLKNSEENFEQLSKNIEEMKVLIETLNSKISDLEAEVGDIEQYKDQVMNYAKKNADLQRAIEDIEVKNKSLSAENESIPKLKYEMENIRQQLSNISANKEKSDLEKQLLEEREKCINLQQELKDVHDKKCESQEIKDLRLKFWRIEKDLNNTKIDKRILERELKEAQSQLKLSVDTLAELKKKLNDQKISHDAVICEMDNINESLSMEVARYREKLTTAENQKKQISENCQQDRSIISELRHLIEVKENKITGLLTEVKNWTTENSNLKLTIEQLRNDVDTLKKRNSEIINQLEKSTHELTNKHANLKALKEACFILEKQVVEYEKLNLILQSKQESLKSNTEKLIADLCKTENIIKETKTQYTEEKAAKSLLESKIKELMEEVEALQNENNIYKTHITEYKASCMDLNDQLKLAEVKASNMKVALDTCNRRCHDLKEENATLKEESAKYLTRVLNLKETNYTLNRNLNEYREDNERLQNSISEMEQIFNEKINFYKQREFRSESVIKQQSKLITYLQTKIDEYNQKKKTLGERLFGQSKRDVLSCPTHVDSALDAERQKNCILQEKILKLESKISLCKCSTYIETNGKKLTKREASNMYTNIITGTNKSNPHRFEPWPWKCAHCFEKISIGENIIICTKCSIVTHLVCSRKITKLCNTLNSHYESESNESRIEAEEKFDDCKTLNLEGRLQILNENKCKWETKYCWLTEKYFKLFENRPADPELCEEMWEFSAAHYSANIMYDPILDEFEGKISQSDLPFIFEFRFTSKDTQRRLILKTSSFAEKKMWFKGFQQILRDVNETLQATTIFKLPQGIVPLCVVPLQENIHLMGALDGLYAIHNECLLHIRSINEVHQIKVMSQINIVVILASSNKMPIFSDLQHLINLAQCAQCTEPHLKYKEIITENIEQFNILEVSSSSSYNYIAAASSNKILISRYQIECENFIPQTILDFERPCTCICFSFDTIILSADKCYKINLNNLQVDEFLNLSDKNLKHINKCYEINSYPISIIGVSDKPKEFLVIFKELAVFVNEYGSLTRSFQLFSKHSPIKFNFHHPYLYIVQLSAVEVIKVTKDLCHSKDQLYVSAPDNFCISFPHIKYLGFDKGVYMSCDSEIRLIQAQTLVEEFVGAFSESSEADDSDKFSFTDSLIQSLDNDDVNNVVY